MELLGKSLDELFHICNKKFSLKTVLMIADQTLNAIEFVHKMHYIYRDIKPNNFLIGKNESSNQIFLIDFGLAKKYIDDSTGEHIPFTQDKSIVGTTRYASANALLGNQQSRKDDMIALGYLWIHFLKGTLPWVGLEPKEDEGSDQPLGKYDEVISLKRYTPSERITEGLPNEFNTYLKSVMELKYDEEPKYSEYRQMFRRLFFRFGIPYDYKFDWSGNPLVEPPPLRKSKNNSVSQPFNPNRVMSTPLSPRQHSLRGNLGATHRLCPLLSTSSTNQNCKNNKIRNSIPPPREGKTNSQLIRPTPNNQSAIEKDYEGSPAGSRPGSKRKIKTRTEIPDIPKLPLGCNDKEKDKLRVSPPIPLPRGVQSPRQKLIASPRSQDVNEAGSSESEPVSNEDNATSLENKDNPNKIDLLKPPSLIQTQRKHAPFIPLNLKGGIQNTPSPPNQKRRSRAYSLRSSAPNSPGAPASPGMEGKDPLAKAFLADILGNY